MLKVTSDVFGSDRRQRRCYRFYQSLFAPGCCLAQHVLDLGEGFFYGVVVRRVRRQVYQLASTLLDQLLDAFGLVG
jgi:hypothetical protein